MKSLSKWYDDGLSDRDKGVEIFNQVEDGLKAVDKISLSEKFKV